MQQRVHFVQTSLLKLEISEIHVLEWPSWSDVFTATIHTARIDDSAILSQIKILGKCRVKAAIAGLG